MLFHCAYTWREGTNGQQVGQRLLQQNEAGTGVALAAQTRGWYNFTGEGRGLLLIESDDLPQLHMSLMAYNDLLSWQVHPVTAGEYDTIIANVRAQTTATP